MTQTARDKTPTPRPKSASSQKLTKPGQRQQERLERIARRRRRQRNILVVVALIFLITAAGVGAWQYQKYSADVQATNNKNSTATAVASITPTPSAGPATPPPVGGQIVAAGDGLEYLDVKVGKSTTTVANGDKVTLQYTLWLKKDGKKMDSSYDRSGEPLAFTIGEEGIIKGFSQGIIGMKEGGTRRIFVPASLGYKDQVVGDIPANSDLIFDVTLLTIEKAG
jgi:FKBP-type peptidyl-prolyl cis-trans isomerase